MKRIFSESKSGLRVKHSDVPEALLLRVVKRLASRFPGLLCVLLVSGAMAACSQNSEIATERPSEETEVPRHVASKGLLLPEVTRKSIGLETVEVTEQKVSAAVEFEIRVFQISGTNALASGSVTPEEAKSLHVEQWVQVRQPEGGTTMATISAINDKLQKNSGFVEVIVQVPSNQGTLAIGRFLKTTVARSTAEAVPTVPREALLECSDGPFVYTLNGDAFLRTSVKVGASNEEVVEVKDGLFSGDIVALRPVMSLWMMELAATKGGQACCVEPPRGK